MKVEEDEGGTEVGRDTNKKREIEHSDMEIDRQAIKNKDEDEDNDGERGYGRECRNEGEATADIADSEHEIYVSKRKPKAGNMSNQEGVKMAEYDSEFKDVLYRLSLSVGLFCRRSSKGSQTIIISIVPESRQESGGPSWQHMLMLLFHSLLLMMIHSYVLKLFQKIELLITCILCPLEGLLKS